MYYKVYENDLSREWILLLHGIGGSSTIWFKQLKMLKKKFNVVLVDLPSHGRAEKINESYGEKYLMKNCIKDMKILLVEIFKKYKLDKIHLMGVSLGTIIIHELLKTESDKIKSVVLVGAVINFNKMGKILVNVASTLKKFIKIKYLYNLMAYILLPYRNNRLSRALFIKEAKKVKENEFRKWFHMLDGIEKIYNEDVYKKEVKKLYVSGKLDHIFIDGVKNNIKKDKQSILKLMEEAGHVCNVDNSEEFNEIIEDFYQWVL